MSILLKNANLIDESGNVSIGRDVVIADGKIAAITPAGKAAAPADAEVVDCTGRFVTPGFAVMHAHSPMNIFKGIAEDVHIDDWFNKELWPYESKMQDEDIYWGARLACAEMLNNGVTVFADHYFKSSLIARACKESGIRADIAYTVFGFGGDCTAELAAAEAFCLEYANDELIAPRMGPHSPYICSESVLRTLSDAAKRLGVGTHLHVSETEAQLNASRASMDGRTPFAVCADNGIFDVPCIIGHGLWVTEEDLKYVNDSMVFAVSPKTYMKLGMGHGHLWELKDRLPIAIGNDGSASSNSIDALEQVRLLGLYGKFEDKAVDFPVKELWQYLMAGHKYLKFNSGRMEVGAAADLNIIDLNKVNTAPIYNPLASILYSSVPAVNITDVMVAGIFRKRDGKLLLDTGEVVENASRCAKAIYARGKGTAQIFF